MADTERTAPTADEVDEDDSISPTPAAATETEAACAHGSGTNDNCEEMTEGTDASETNKAEAELVEESGVPQVDAAGDDTGVSINAAGDDTGDDTGDDAADSDDFVAGGDQDYDGASHSNDESEDGYDQQYDHEYEMYRRQRASRKTSMQSYIKNRPRTSQLVQEALNIDTQDVQDHTFNGIMFDVKAADYKPLEFLLVESVWVRGALGPVSVYVTKEPGSFNSVKTDPDAWNKIYSGTHGPNFEEYTELKLAESVKICAGERFGMYVHSELRGDDGIVYDNTTSRMHGQDDNVLKHGTLVVEPHGCAHLCHRAFESRNPWGWGSGWRPDREFVGRISYGVRWMLWNPECDAKFPSTFRTITFTFLAAGYRANSIVSMLPQEMVLYILNFCDWNFFGDDLKLPSQKAAVQRERQPARQGGRQFYLSSQDLRDLIQQMQAGAADDM